MTGTCKPGKQEHKSSDPLALEQFLSAFLLLMSGILLAAVLLGLEHVYFKYVRKRLAKTDRGGCCALISLVSIAADWLLPKLARLINPLKAELNPICHLLALLGGATIVVVSRLRVNKPVNLC